MHTSMAPAEEEWDLTSSAPWPSSDVVSEVRGGNLRAPNNVHAEQLSLLSVEKWTIALPK